MPNALNLAYGGGTIPEIYSTFSLIKSDPAIKNLVVGVQLRSFDEDHKGGMNRVPEAVELVRHKLEYLKNWNVFQTTLKVFEKENEKVINQYGSLVSQANASSLGREGNTSLSKLLEPDVCFGCDLPDDLAPVVQQKSHRKFSYSGRNKYNTTGWGYNIPDYNWSAYQASYNIDYQIPNLPKKFENQVTKNAKSDWRGFEFSQNYWKHFEEMGAWAKSENKNLIFVIPPTITNLQNTIQENGLGKINHQLRVKLAELGTVVDLDYPNKLTQDANRFNDAYHFNSKVARQIVGQVIPFITENKDAIKKVNKKMTVEKKTQIASFAILTSLSTVIVASALSLHKPYAQSTYVPDPVTKKELQMARGFVKAKDWQKAADILDKNAVGANVQAKYEYAMLFAKGWGVPRDLEKARNLLLQAVQRPFKDRAKAAFELGRVYRMSKGVDCSRIAFEWFTKSAEWGYTKAHNELGKSYSRGIGVRQNIELALKHYRIAAVHKSSSAVLPLIELLAKGSASVPANPERAAAILHEFMLRWLAMAAGSGDAIAMHDMAMLIMETKKEQANKADVMELLNESARRDYAAATTTLGRLHLKRKFGLPQRKSVEFFNKGIVAGHPGSMEELGRLYLKGKHVQYDLAKARELAEQGTLLKHSGSKKLLDEINKIEAKKNLEASVAMTEREG